MAKRLCSILASGALALSLGLMGCGGSAEEAPEDGQTPQAASAAVDTRNVMGTVSEGAIEIALKNGLGVPIESVSLRAGGTMDYGDNLIPEGGSIAPEEEVRLFFMPVGAAPTYDVKVTAGGEIMEFVQAPMSTAVQVVLRRADGVSYVDFVAPDGGVGSTLEAILSAPEAPVEEEVPEENPEAIVAMERTTDVAASEQPAAYDDSEDYGYEAEPAVAMTEAPVEAPTAPAQTEDTCVDDVVLKN